MLPEKDVVRLRHILTAAQEASGAAAGRRREDLDNDRGLMHTLVHCLEIIGEAATQMSAVAREELPDVEWVRAIQMRNRLIHAYHDVNLGVVWSTVAEDLPPLVEAVKVALEQESL